MYVESGSVPSALIWRFSLAPLAVSRLKKKVRGLVPLQSCKGLLGIKSSTVRRVTDDVAIITCIPSRVACCSLSRGMFVEYLALLRLLICKDPISESISVPLAALSS